MIKKMFKEMIKSSNIQGKIFIVSPKKFKSNIFFKDEKICKNSMFDEHLFCQKNSLFSKEDKNLLSNRKKPKYLNENLLRSINEQIISYLKILKDNNDIPDENFSANKVIEYKSPKEMKEIFDFEISENDNALKDDEFLEITRKILKYSVHTGHKNFLNTLYAGNDEYALSGDFLSSILNGTMFTYEMAPVFNLMEQSLFQKFAEWIGWKNFDGIMCPGGSIGNLYALLISRYLKYPEVKTEGIRSLPELIIFTSELGHYSIEKASISLGYGLKSVWKIPCDAEGKIIVSEFKKLVEKAKKENKIPHFLNCTVGTTVFATIDPIDDLAEICKENSIHMHIDACLGGALLFLQEYRNKILKGIEKADSIVIDTHKVFPVPYQCSFFITKHQNSLFNCNSIKAEYLFMKDKIIYDASLDSGDSSIQCGRHVDILKLWLYLKGNGLKSIQSQIRNAIQLAKYLAERIKEHPNFVLIVEPDYINVSFYYFSDKLLKKFNLETRNKVLSDLENNTNIDWDEVAKLAPSIKAKMMKEGTLMISYQNQTQQARQLKNFFRAVITITKEKKDVDFILDEIHRLGQNI